MADKRHPSLVSSWCSELEKGHGRLEQRSIRVISTTSRAIDANFKGVKQVAMVCRTRENLTTGEKSTEVVYLITNLSPSEITPEGLLLLNRSYWSIENQLHYRLDESFGEDRSTIRAKNGPRVMSSLRKLAVSILGGNGVKNIKRCVDNLKHNASRFLSEAFALSPV